MKENPKTAYDKLRITHATNFNSKNRISKYKSQVNALFELDINNMWFQASCYSQFMG